MKKELLIATAVLGLLFAPSIKAVADGYDLTFKSLEEIVDLANASVADGDFIPMYDTSAGTIKKFSAEGIAELDTVLNSLTATAAEINKVADDSARVVEITGTYALTAATNGTGVINYVSSSASNATITFPAATGTGTCYKLVWQAAPAAGGDTVQVTGNDEFQGVVFTLTDDTANAEGWAAAIGSDNDSITLDSATKFAAGGLARLNVCDVDTDTLHIEGFGNSTGTEATPFATGQRS